MSTRLPPRTRRSLIGIAAVVVMAVGGRVIVNVWHERHEQLAPAATPTSFIVSGSTNGPTPQHTGRYSLLALGDSYTIGQSIDPTGRWPVQLALQLRRQNLDVTDPDILARNGWTTADLLAAMDAAKLAAPPPRTYDEVLLLIGVNNQFRGQPLANYRTDFHTLLQRSIQLARGDPRRVIALSIPDWGATPYGQAGNPARTAAEIAPFNASALALCTDAGVAFIDITPVSEHAATQPALVADDGLHPSAEQYAQWVQLALPAAQAALQLPPSTRP